MRRRSYPNSWLTSEKKEKRMDGMNYVTRHAIDGDESNVNIVLDGRWGAIVPKANAAGVEMLLTEAIKLIRCDEPSKK